MHCPWTRDWICSLLTILGLSTVEMPAQCVTARSPQSWQDYTGYNALLWVTHSYANTPHIALGEGNCTQGDLQRLRHQGKGRYFLDVLDVFSMTQKTSLLLPVYDTSVITASTAPPCRAQLCGLSTSWSLMTWMLLPCPTLWSADSAGRVRALGEWCKKEKWKSQTERHRGMRAG